jgi:6-phosphogluconolactonase
VLQYDVDPATGALTPKAPASVPAGDTSEGIAVSSDGKSVYVANINDGTVSQYDVAAGGALSPKNPATVPSGRGPTDVALTPDGRSAYVYDSGIGGGAPPVDAVSQYNVNAANGTLSPKSPATVAARSGSTASELAASPDGRSLYVVNGALVSQYTIDPSAGTLTPKSPSTVPNAGDGIGIAIASPRSFPTSKDQCKKGGWRNFGMFRNQGDCVSFVATGGKKKPKG